MITDMKEYMKEYNKKYYLEHKEKIKVATIKWAKENPEKVKGYTKKINNSQKARDRKDKWIIENKEKNAECKNNWRKAHAERDKIKIHARNMSSKIPLKSSCEICGEKKSLQKHHWRYDKPLLVNTLCSTCHEIQHVRNFNQSKFAGGGSFGR